MYTVDFAPEALEQLAALYRYIATASSPETAQRYTTRSAYHELSQAGRDSRQVFILGIFYGGQDFEAALQFEWDE